MDVTDILRDRMQEPAGLQKMVSVSLLLHGALIAGLLLAPRGLLMQGGRRAARDHDDHAERRRRRSVQRRADLDWRTSDPGPDAAEETKRDPVRPPAAKAPEMTLPVPRAKPLKAAGPIGQGARRCARPDADARGRRTAGHRGGGNRRARHGLRALDRRRSRHRVEPRRHRGLLLSGLRGADGRDAFAGAGISRRKWPASVIDQVHHRARRHHHAGFGREDQRATTSSTSPLERAVQITRKLPPLPAQFTNPTLTVHLNFQYQR